MANASSFNRLPVNLDKKVTVYIEGEPVVVSESDTVASAVLAAGIGHSRTTAVSGSKRAPYCMMGICFECLMTIDGIANSQGCMTLVKDGMRIERQIEAREITSAFSLAIDATEAK